MNKYIVRMRTRPKAQAFGKQVPCKERPRIQTKCRMIGCGLLRIIAAVAIVLIALLLLAARSNSKPVVWKEYTVQSGDTLWAIAREEYGNDVDIRKVIAEIAEANGIRQDKLMPGDVILVPWEVE